MQSSEITVRALQDVPEVRPGDDLAALILDAASERPLMPGDILVVTQKVVSKAEGRLVDLRVVTPSDLARRFAETYDKDPRHIEVVLRETARIVRMDRGIIISETRHGFVCANAGVDASNVDGEETVCLLPADPDASAARLRQRLCDALGFDVPVIISDSFGRPWRNGIVNVAIGVAGLEPLTDYRGQPDAAGREMKVSVLAVADELAAAAELVMGKVDQAPVAVISGYQWQPSTATSRALVMERERDLFR